MIFNATRCILRTFPAAFSMRIHSSHSDILRLFIHSARFKTTCSLFPVVAFGATTTEPDNFGFSPLITAHMFLPQYLFHSISSYWWATKRESLFLERFISRQAALDSAAARTHHFSRQRHSAFVIWHCTGLLFCCHQGGKASGEFRFSIRKTGNLSPIRNTAVISINIVLLL